MSTRPARFELLRHDLDSEGLARVEKLLAAPDSAERTEQLDILGEAEAIYAASIRREWSASGRLEVV